MERKTPNKPSGDPRAMMWVNLLMGAVITVAGLWGGTQYVARAFGYAPALGSPWFTLGGHRVYAPWRLMQWDTVWGGRTIAAPFLQGYLILAGSLLAQLGLLYYLALWRARHTPGGNAYGSARWATERELRDAGLLAGEGIVLGQTERGELIQHQGPEHALVFAPPRSGKGVGLVIPTLLTWRGSVIVYDIKRENWHITAGFRSKFSHCLRFEPTAHDSVRYNPLFEVRKGPHEFRDVQNIADIIVDSGEALARTDHWERTSKALLIAATLHVLYAEQDKSLPGVANFLADPDRDHHQTLRHMLSCRHLGESPHPIVASLTREVLDKAENELSGVFSTLMAFLTLYRDPVIAANLRRSDFRIADLMHLEHPVSLYLTIPASDVDRTKPLMRLLLNQMGRRLTESMSYDHDKPAHRHRLLLMIDEFPTLGRMDFFESELAYLPSYGIRAYLITQSLNQIEKHYGASNSILDNAHIRVTYGSLDERTAKRISDMLGQATEVRRMANYAGNRLSPFLGHMMVSEQESPRPLLTPGEVLSLSPERAIVMVGGMMPYLASKVRYYADARFSARAQLPPPDSVEAQRAELPTQQACEWQAALPVAMTTAPEAAQRVDEDCDRADAAFTEERNTPLDASRAAARGQDVQRTEERAQQRDRLERDRAKARQGTAEQWRQRIAAPRQEEERTPKVGRGRGAKGLPI